MANNKNTSNTKDLKNNKKNVNMNDKLDLLDDERTSPYRSLEQIDEDAALTVLDELKGDESPRQIVMDIINRTNIEISLKNSVLDQRNAMRRDISYIQLAIICAKLHGFVKLFYSDTSYDSYQYAVYMDEGENKGTYRTDVLSLKHYVNKYRLYPSSTSDEKLFYNTLDKYCPIKYTINGSSEYKDLIAVNNGIFNFKTKEFLDFSPEYVFLSKSKVDYNPEAKNVVLYHPDGVSWDVESWFESLSDDEEIVDLLWQVTCAILRPNTNFNQCVFLYATSGNNGKGTFCRMLRNLIGSSNSVSIPMKNFSKPFALVSLLQTQAIIVDENPNDVFHKDLSDFKAVVTHDDITIDIKYKNSVTIKPYCTMVQCINALPETRDKSDSFYRRQLIIPMTKQFKGIERKDIKNEMLANKEVLEYVMYKCLHMEYFDKFDQPQQTLDMLEESKELNDSAYSFWKEFKDQFVWDVLPNAFLYDLYLSWYKQNISESSYLSKIKFLRRIKDFVNNDSNSIWAVNSDTSLLSGAKINSYEPLINDYDLKDWFNEEYKGDDLVLKATPGIDLCSKRYKGLYKKKG